MEIRVYVRFAVLFQNVIDSHNHTRVQIIETGVRLHIRQHRNQSHEIGGHNAGQSRQIECGGRVRNKGLSDLVEFSELLVIADSVSHIDTSLVAFAVAGDGHFRSISSVFLAQHAGREGSIGTRDAVGMTLRYLALSVVVEESVVKT